VTRGKENWQDTPAIYCQCDEHTAGNTRGSSRHPCTPRPCSESVPALCGVQKVPQSVYGIQLGHSVVVDSWGIKVGQQRWVVILDEVCMWYVCVMTGLVHTVAIDQGLVSACDTVAGVDGSHCGRGVCGAVAGVCSTVCLCLWRTVVGM
jgi:hypothetical protein